MIIYNEPNLFKNKYLNITEPIFSTYALKSKIKVLNISSVIVGSDQVWRPKYSLSIPPKRYDKEKISLDFKLVQKQRMVVRKQSLVQWPKNDSYLFDEVILGSRDKLQKRTKINHYIRAIKRKM